jgi:hypothetical protein
MANFLDNIPFNENNVKGAYVGEGKLALEIKGTGGAPNDDAPQLMSGRGAGAPVIEFQQGRGAGPGKRLNNPLGNLSSYTYNLSLYMVTPEAYNTFVESGETSVEGFHIVAESGGVARSSPKGIPLFKYDYYIDDLSFKTFVNTKTTDGPTVDSTQFEFKIYEPYGFKFVSDLKNAARLVSSQTAIQNGSTASYYTQQIYMLGIKFYGYDIKGNVVKPAQMGSTPGSDESALFPRFFPLTLTGISFRLDGKATVYSIKAQNVSVQASFGTKRGLIKNQIELKGETVEEIISSSPTYSLMAVLNKLEDDLITGGLNKTVAAELKNKYQVKFIDDGKIRSAKVVDEGDWEIKNYRAGTSDTIKKTSESNDKNSVTATAKFNRKNRTFSIPAGTSIHQAVDLIIGHSAYVRDSITAQYTETVEPEKETGENSQATNKEFQWFTVTPVAKVIGYDRKRQGYVYDTTYIINNYKVPYVRSPFVSKSTPYPGPHKRYEYIYTGNSNEILSYEQTYNSLYYIDSIQQSTPNTDPPAEVNFNSKVNESDSVTYGKAGAAAATIRNSLYSPGDKATAKITILGDPDFLVTTTATMYDVWGGTGYGPDGSMDAHSSQVFIEIKFNEANDYNMGTGVMDIQNNVEIYRYPPELESVLNGAITYMVVDVVSTFSRGRFTQDLNLVLWSPPVTGGSSTKSKTPVTSAVSSPATNKAPTIEETNRSIVNTITANPVSPVYQGKSTVGFPQAQTGTQSNAPNIAGVIAANQFNQRTNASIVGAITSPTNPKPTQGRDDDNSQSSKDRAWINNSGFTN